MLNHESSLPDAWVERIFKVLRATYGAAFDRQWECPAGVDPARFAQDMKDHWSRELRGLKQNPMAIGHALDYLPERPPNLIEFRNLCARRPDPQTLALPAPKADPARVAAAIGSIRRPDVCRDPKQWARDIMARSRAGERLPIAHLTMARDAGA